MNKNYVDIKSTVWQRHHFKDDADMNKIVELIKQDPEMIFDEEIGFLETETLYETQTEMDLSMNDEFSTIEVYCEQCEFSPIYQNGK